jgi:hypothetical protein
VHHSVAAVFVQTSDNLGDFLMTIIWKNLAAAAIEQAHKIMFSSV